MLYAIGALFSASSLNVFEQLLNLKVIIEWNKDLRFSQRFSSFVTYKSA